MKVIDVIIVGFGKIGQIHYNCYKKNHYLPVHVRCIVDPAIELVDFSFGSDTPHLLKSTDDIDSSCQVNDDFLIVDICVPNELHYSEFKKAYNMFPNAYFFIEKPVCATVQQFDEIISLSHRVLVCENYLYSTTSQFVKDIIVNYSLCVKSIKTVFNKNRIKDTLQMRGVASGGKIQTAFDIEIPHQISIASDIAGRVTAHRVIKCDPMIYGDVSISHMGSCEIQLEHQSNVLSQHLSSLTQVRARILEISCNDKIIILADYPAGDSFNSKVSIYRGEHLIASYALLDDTITTMIKYFVTIIVLSGNKDKNFAIRLKNICIARQIVEIIEGANRDLLE